MKTILIPIEQHSTLLSVLETALRVGRSVEGSTKACADSVTMAAQLSEK